MSEVNKFGDRFKVVIDCYLKTGEIVTLVGEIDSDCPIVAVEGSGLELYMKYANLKKLIKENQ